jgi:hypothetical protein
MSISSILDLVARGSESLVMSGSSVQVPEYTHKPLLPLAGRNPHRVPYRTPQEVMRGAWQDVGNRLYGAMEDVRQRL